MKHDFRLNAIAGKLYDLVCSKLDVSSMSRDDRDWLVFEYDDQTHKLRCFENYIEDQNLLQEIDVEICMFLPLFAVRVVRGESCWGTKQEVIDFRNRLKVLSIPPGGGFWFGIRFARKDFQLA